MNNLDMSNLVGQDLYKLLELNEAECHSVTEDHIRAAYRKRALVVHPDKNPNKDKKAAQRDFIELNEAFKLLAFKATRDAYDAMRKAKREKAKRDEQLDKTRRDAKEKLEKAEQKHREKLEQRTAQARHSKEEDRLHAEIERLRNEGSILLEAEMNFINEQMRGNVTTNKKRTNNELLVNNSTLNKAERTPPRIKFTWSSDISNITEEFLRSILEKYGQIEALFVSKKSSAILEYKHVADARKCFLDAADSFKSKYALSMLWLGDLDDLHEKISKKASVSAVNEVQFDLDTFEDMEAAVLKKLKQGCTATAQN